MTTTETFSENYNLQISFKKIFSWNFLFIYGLVIVSTITDQFLNKRIEAIIRSPDGISSMIWVWGVGSLVSSFLFPMLISMLCCFVLSGTFASKKLMLVEKFELVMLESFRAWGRTFLWCYLFILPGLFKYVFYLMTPFVVLFSKPYARGAVDALKHSEAITKKMSWKFIIALFFFSTLLPIFITSTLDEYKLFYIHPLTAFGCALLDSVLIFIFHFVVLRMFVKALDEAERMLGLKLPTARQPLPQTFLPEQS